jgi:hypothetical protein
METELEAILKEIESIKDNGNNTASKLRTVLTDMLNFRNDGFEISSPDLVTTKTQHYHYSFKGTKKQCCNVFLILNNNTNDSDLTTGNAQVSGNVFSFEIKPEEYDILRDFIPDSAEDKVFLVYNLPIMNGENSKMARVFLNKEIDIKNNATLFTVTIRTELTAGESVITTLPLNYKKFTMPKEVKNTVRDFGFMVRTHIPK